MNVKIAGNSKKRKHKKICIQTGKKRNWEKLIGKSNSCKDFKNQEYKTSEKTKQTKQKQKNEKKHENTGITETIVEASWLTRVQFP